MAESAPTIIDLKLAFLRTQIAALTAPVRIPPSYRPSADAPIRQKAIDDALYQLNAKIQEHSKLVYSSLAQRHVAEQIDALYWMAGERDGNGDVEGRLEVGVDMSTEAAITTLPEVWDEPEEASRMPNEAIQYTELAARLKERNSRRAEMKRRIAQYQKLRDELEPFGDVRENVQENLCTRDGPMEAELQKMRMLLARVKGRLENMNDTPRTGDGEEMDLDDVDEAKQVSMLFDS